MDIDLLFLISGQMYKTETSKMDLIILDWKCWLKSDKINGHFMLRLTHTFVPVSYMILKVIHHTVL